MKHSQITKQKVILSTKHSFPLKWHAVISIHAASSEWCVTYCSSYWAERKMGARKGSLQFWIDPIVCRGIQKGNLFRHENWFRSFSLQFEPEHLELPWADLEAEVLMSSGHGCISVSSELRMTPSRSSCVSFQRVLLAGARDWLKT